MQYIILTQVGQHVLHTIHYPNTRCIPSALVGTVDIAVLPTYQRVLFCSSKLLHTSQASIEAPGPNRTNSVLSLALFLRYSVHYVDMRTVGSILLDDPIANIHQWLFPLLARGYWAGTNASERMSPSFASF